mgnify:FL=1
MQQNILKGQEFSGMGCQYIFRERAKTREGEGAYSARSPIVRGVKPVLMFVHCLLAGCSVV